MKIIRPENSNEFKKEDILIIDGREVTSFESKDLVLEVDFNEPKSIEQLMQQTIDENKIKVEVTLTRKQYDLWNKKGGEKWLKRLLTGQKKR